MVNFIKDKEQANLHQDKEVLLVEVVKVVEEVELVKKVKIVEEEIGKILRVKNFKVQVNLIKQEVLNQIEKKIWNL